MELPGRGTTFVRSLPGPPGAPTLVLLHGWTASADLNWFRCYEPLGEQYRVLALDHRGHGKGIRSKKTFRLEDCADDAVADLARTPPHLDGWEVRVDILDSDRYVRDTFMGGARVALQQGV
jgi:pimeloyl-ACP methyl ester carboxylesterase